MDRRLLVVVSSLAALVLVPTSLSFQKPADQVQVSPPPVTQIGPPSPNASAEELERQGDNLRAAKAYLDALDYYRAALKKEPAQAKLYNKAGISELLLQHFRDAHKDFQRAIKLDRQYADAYNNNGAVYYAEKRYGKAIKQYNKAIELRKDSASYYSNLGAAYFSKKEFVKAIAAYGQAVQIDPDIFARSSQAGVSVQWTSPEDRAHFDYVMAKLYAKDGLFDRSLQCLRRAMEESYKEINDVYTDPEFTELRKDPRFAELMADKPKAIPE
jgi:tetratricopeptide (TPR) repeat protein